MYIHCAFCPCSQASWKGFGNDVIASASSLPVFHSSAGSDYTAVAPTVIIFGEDETFLPASVAIINNRVVEGVEEFGVGVRVVEGEMGVIIRNGTAVVRIVDDDGSFMIDCTAFFLQLFTCVQSSKMSLVIQVRIRMGS